MTGSISKDSWEIDLTNGTLTIGNISADKITSGTIDAAQITVTNLNADNITAGFINGSRITDMSIEGGKIKNSTLSGLKLEDFAITEAKLDSKSVSGEKIKDLTITGSNIANTTLPGDKMEWHTLSDDQMVGGGLSTFSVDDEINTSLDRADFSHGVFNNTETANYCHAKNITVDSVLTAEDRFFTKRMFVDYGGQYFEATWQKISIPTFTNKYLKVYDGEDKYIGYTERFYVATDSSEIWVLKH